MKIQLFSHLCQRQPITSGSIYQESGKLFFILVVKITHVRLDSLAMVIVPHVLYFFHV